MELFFHFYAYCFVKSSGIEHRRCETRAQIQPATYSIDFIWVFVKINERKSLEKSFGTNKRIKSKDFLIFFERFNYFVRLTDFSRDFCLLIFTKTPNKID